MDIPSFFIINLDFLKNQNQQQEPFSNIFSVSKLLNRFWNFPTGESFHKFFKIWNFYSTSAFIILINVIFIMNFQRLCFFKFSLVLSQNIQWFWMIRMLIRQYYQLQNDLSLKVFISLLYINQRSVCQFVNLSVCMFVCNPISELFYDPTLEL